MHDRDVVERIRPVWMRGANIDIRFGGHPRVADRMGTAELGQPVLIGHARCITQVFDEFQRVPNG